MIDEKLYRETFSRLQASDEAKKEVLLKMNEMSGKSARRPLRVLRTLAIAAALTLALAVTANAASNGELFKTLRIIWQDGSTILMEDNLGNQITVTTSGYDNAEIRDGKLSVKGIGDGGSASSVMTGQFTMESSDGTEVKINVTEEPPVGVEVSTEGAASYSVNVASDTGEVSYSKNTESGTAADSPAAEDITTYVVTTGD